MDKEKKIEDLLASIYKLVQEAKVEKENILSKNNLNLKKNFENKKEKFIDVVYKSNDSKNSENYILEICTLASYQPLNSFKWRNKILDLKEVRAIVIEVAKTMLKQNPKIATCNVINAPSSSLGKASKM